MLKALAEYIVKNANVAPNQIKHGPFLFVDKDMKKLPTPSPSPIMLHSLSGIVGMVKAEKARYAPVYVVINSPTEVVVFTGTHEDEERFQLYKASPVLPDIPFKNFIDHESMLIILRSRFVQDAAVTELIQEISSIRDENVMEAADNGMAQMVTAKQGIATVAKKTLNPIRTLTPYRTFLEVEQPPSEFLFRMRSGAQGEGAPTMALFEADGGAWRIEANANIAAYLTKELEGIEGVMVIQ